MRERVIWLLRLSRCLSCGTKLKWISTSSLATQPAHRVCLHPAPTTTPILCHARPCIAPEFKAWLQQPLFVTVIAYGMSRDQLRTPHFETPHPPFCGRCQEGTMARKQQIIFPEPEDEVIVEARRFWSSVAMYPPPAYLPSLNLPSLSLCVHARFTLLDGWDIFQTIFILSRPARFRDCHVSVSHRLKPSDPRQTNSCERNEHTAFSCNKHFNFNTIYSEFSRWNPLGLGLRVRWDS